MSNKEVELNRDADGLVREETQGGIYIKPKYTPEDLKDNDYARDIGDPGVYPFTRGIYPKMFRDRLWLKAFLVSYDTPESTNAAFKSYIENGLNDLRLTCDLPTQNGFDPDHPLALSSMFCGGICSYAINTYEIMLEGLPLENTVYEGGFMNVLDAIYFHGLLVAMIENRGGDISKLLGTDIADPIRSKLVYGDPSWPTEVERRVLQDHIEYCLEHTPKWKPVVPNGIDPCQAGMNAVHELGEVLAVATAVLDDFCARGHSIDEFGPMVFAMDAESDVFESIAKFRAARRMWARIAKERFGAKKDSTMKLKIGIRTSGLSLQAQKPLNNAARVTLQTLAGVLGGVNSIDACSIDEAMGLPSHEARMFTMDMQQILVHEANIPLTADPLGGSYYLEALTDQLEVEASAYLHEIEKNGGVFACLESGWLYGIMEEDRLRCQQEKASGKRLIVGNNAYVGEEGAVNKAIADCVYTVPLEDVRRERIAEVKAFRASRDPEQVAQAVKRLYDDTKSGANISRAVIDGGKVGLTIGEVCGIVRLGYGLSYDSVNMIETPDYIKGALKEAGV
ncbi:MAG: methylmalonyl-CoA mutase family protein [Christensenella sp.]|uniref:methylmalonyl-CoA mutase family protein n=1 Tax=Christensenella sp. TaxID=1935934 RepID=UPI002B21E448|nr:methylmalonyl-CoA mutase family protein [Christensenella sp.]MEA5002517.1 methylmalonyl-CoA mutase family protein [Christensenella sp.]